MLPNKPRGVPPPPAPSQAELEKIALREWKKRKRVKMTKREAALNASRQRW
jgi:hypothetical protein